MSSTSSQNLDIGTCSKELLYNPACMFTDLAVKTRIDVITPGKPVVEHGGDEGDQSPPPLLIYQGH
jgi:hypothetical protein